MIVVYLALADRIRVFGVCMSGEGGAAWNLSNQPLPRILVRGPASVVVILASAARLRFSQAGRRRIVQEPGLGQNRPIRNHDSIPVIPVIPESESTIALIPGIRISSRMIPESCQGCQGCQGCQVYQNLLYN